MDLNTALTASKDETVPVADRIKALDFLIDTMGTIEDSWGGWSDALNNMGKARNTLQEQYDAYRTALTAALAEPGAWDFLDDPTRKDIHKAWKKGLI